MAQPEFELPDFLKDVTADSIHERMMENLPDDIDDMPGGFPYDLTKPAADEKDDLINSYIVRALMAAFPEYAWGDLLDLHGRQVHLTRHEPQFAKGVVTVTGEAGTAIAAGTVFCTAAIDDDNPSLNYVSLEDATIPESGTVDIEIRSQEGGKKYNVGKSTITMLYEPIDGVESIINENATTGGTDEESDDDFYDRIDAEYENNRTYLGNDADYVRWAKEAGAGDCIVIAPTEEKDAGKVRLALIDQNGDPASDELVKAVYDYIVSDNDRARRLLPTACAELTVVAATTRAVNYTITGLQLDDTTSVDQVKKDFEKAVAAVYQTAKSKNVLRYNDVRPVIKGITGVVDYETFLIDGKSENITLKREEYPMTGKLDFS